MGSIYMITNTENGKAYIGKTVNDAFKTRIKTHLDGYGNADIQEAVSEYGVDVFDVEILHDGIIPELLDSYEVEAIAKYDTYHNGYNRTTGGGGYFEVSDETRKKMSEATKNQTHSEETRRRMSETMIGEKNHFYGKAHSEETRKKMSDAQKGNKNHNYGKRLSEEHRRKIGEAHKGKTISDETRRKMSESSKGQVHSAETLQKISETHKGKHVSAETRRKLSEAAKRQWQRQKAKA